MGFEIQNIISFHTQSSISGGWLDVRSVKTKKLLFSKSFKNVDELESLKQKITIETISLAIKKELGL